MSSSAGLMAYSSLFSSGIETSGRLPLASSRDFIGYRSPRGHHGFPREIPSNVDSRRPSAADTESTNSRRSSLPTFSSGSDRRYGGKSSYYAANQAKSPQAISFTPSVLMRSDTNATKRSHFKSFLSMDANDLTQLPPIPNNLRSSTTPGYANTPQWAKHTRAASVASATRAPSSLQSPHFNQLSYNSDDIKPISNGSPQYAEGARRSISQSLYEEPTYNTHHHRSRAYDTASLRTYDGIISDEPPRLEVRLDSSSSRISFNPSDHGHTTEQERYADARKSSLTDPHSIPPRPDHEPRVRSSLPANSVILSPPPAAAPPSLQRNMSIVSTSTFKSATPSQRSAIKRSRRDEALARLEGNFYDPAPHIQASGSFMPFESDDEEDEADRSANSMLRKLVISPAQSSPPPIKPPSPLRARDREQRKLLETGRLDSTLDTIVEATFTPSPRTEKEFSAARTRPDQPPSIIVHSSMWPVFDEEEEEESLVTPQPPPSAATPRAAYAPSPLGSRTNLELVMRSANHSSTSLSSFTPFSSTDAVRPRNGAKLSSTSANPSPIHKPQSGPGSINTLGSASRQSHDDASVESFDSRDLGAALMDSNLSRSKQQQQSMSSVPWGSSSSIGHELTRSPWVQGPTGMNGMAAPQPRERTGSKAREGKPKKGPVQYETWLDMGGDEKKVAVNKDGSKKRRWLFGK